MPIHRFAAALLACCALGCGCGPKECTECLDVSGYWVVTIENWSFSGTCYVWAVRSRTEAWVTQSASKIDMDFVGQLFSGHLYENNQMVLTSRGQIVYGGWSENETDTIVINVNGDATRFDGTWTVSSTWRDPVGRTESCSGSARLDAGRG